MQNSILVVFPPILVLFLAIITKKVIPSLLAGIATAALIATDFSPYESLALLSHTVATTLLDISNIYTFGFLIMLGTLTILVTTMGGITAYTKSLEKYIKNAKTAQITSLIFSNLFFIDDYLNSLTVGNIMRPITDKFRVPRAKLAYLVDSASGSLCLLIPASSWLAVILPQLKTSGVSLLATDNPKVIADPFGLYLSTIPYIFYPLFTLFSAWLIVLTHKSYGSMADHEQAALTGDLFNGEKPLSQKSEAADTGSLWYFILPISSLIALIFLGILWTGNSLLLGGTHSLIQTIQNTHIIHVLFSSSLITVTLSGLYFIFKGKLTLRKMAENIVDGALSMQSSIMLLICAWILASLLKNDLQTGQYIADMLLGSLSIGLLPSMFFITATFISAATGSSWGTIQIMLPIAIPMLYEFAPANMAPLAENIPLLLPSLGALFSGSLAGAHISPISDTTVTASTGAQSYHIDHVKTQFSYALTAITGTLAAYITAAIFMHSKYMPMLSFVVGIAIMTIIHSTLNRRKKTI